jgi:HlyD family secretion protein
VLFRSYKTVLSVKNDDLALRPCMTATASIVTAQRNDALLVPNAALRFVPPVQGEEAKGGGFVASLLPRPSMDAKRPKAAANGQPQVWVLDEAGPRAIAVKIGVSNGRQTEIVSGELKPGMAVITDYQAAKP